MCLKFLFSLYFALNASLKFVIINPITKDFSPVFFTSSISKTTFLSNKLTKSMLLGVFNISPLDPNVKLCNLAFIEPI